MNPTVSDMQAALDKVSSTALRDRRGSLESLPIQQVGFGPVVQMLPKVRDTIVIVFYSGIGFTIDGVDYLAISDTNIDPKEDNNLSTTSMWLRRMLDRLRENAVTIVALDTKFIPARRFVSDR